MKRTTFAAVTMTLALLAAACGSDDDGATDTTTANTPTPATDVVETSTVATADVPAAASTVPETDPAMTTPATTPSSDTVTTAAEASWPVTIDHRFGSTTIDARPERVVSLDTQWTDVLVALGAPLAAEAIDPSSGDTGRFPWQTDVPASVEGIPVVDQIPFEAIAAAEPDLIVITYFLTDESDYETLSQIAPTIALLTDNEVDSWQDIATAAGEIFGDQQAAADLIDEAAQRNADLLAEMPGLEGKTYAFANYVPGDAMYVVADPDDGSATFFGQIGLQIDPDLLAIADGATGRVKLSLESIDQLDADVLILLTNGADPDEIAGYSLLPAVQSGAVAILDVATITGLNTPTPLSIPYALGVLHPALVAAAA